MKHVIIIQLNNRINRITVEADNRAEALAFARTAFPDAEMIK